MPEEKAEQLAGQECPVCHKKTLTLTEQEKEVPFFGRVYLFSMSCENCRYHKADVESAEQREPCKYTIEISSEEDMKIRVVKSSQATIKIPRITTITPGPASNGFITNIEGIFNRVKNQVEFVRDNAEDAGERKKAKNMLKKIMNIMWGREKIKMTIEDPSGNSAIISDKAVKQKL
ncbi:ZPR1 zinc finger domain-containing protein [Candidatus Woesearchaeota archaeon]|nr:ZPR1 zinc finger domain-containing protein [Candidatus Woesearchaeota archaeon]